MPFFSIITVVFNAEAVVEATARSLQSQTFRDFEWIVIDGGSSDRTLDVIQPFLAEGRDTVISEADRGVYDAMNKGLRLAKGEVVQFLNAGDRLAYNTVLGDVAAAFDDDVDAVYGDTVFELSNGLIIPSPAKDVTKHDFRSMPFCHQSFFPRREIHLRHPFDLSFKIAADYASIATMYRAGVRMKRIETTLSVMTIEPGAISKSGQSLAAGEDVRINKAILKRSTLSETLHYACKRLSLFVGDSVRSLPPAVYDRLPLALRRRIY